MYAILRATIKHSLGQYNVAPVLDFNRDANLEFPIILNKSRLLAPKITVDPDFNPFKEEVKKKIIFLTKEKNNRKLGIFIHSYSM